MSKCAKFQSDIASTWDKITPPVSPLLLLQEKSAMALQAKRIPIALKPKPKSKAKE
jgi:hypothetical protein